MKGIQHIEVSNRYAKYKFDLFRNITVIQGDSGTGKTTLFNMIADYCRDHEKSGVNLSSTAACMALTDMDWEHQLEKANNCIVFIDEDSEYISTVAFAAAVKKSSNYFVIFSREGLHNLPYSVHEIYEIKTSGKYHTLKKLYAFSEKNEFKPKGKSVRTRPKRILTEDSQAGYQFFEEVSRERGIICVSAGSNSAVFPRLKELTDGEVILICDGAAFGAEIDKVVKLMNSQGNVRLFLPESFEWMILKSGIIDGVKSIVDNPSAYIESQDYFSWERFFTFLLVEKTKAGYLAYSKGKLNHVYLHDREKRAILAILPEI